jgi:uncharacterized protein (DUF2237 family)
MLRDDSGNGGGRPSSPRNVLGDRLDVCSMEPKTGFFRDGCCNTNGEDVGSHTVCAVMTAAFLEFSKSRGNDLSTPLPRFGFPGLRPGDRWCLCAPRWQEALEAGCAPRVVLRATHEGALRAAHQRFAIRFEVALSCRLDVCRRQIGADARDQPPESVRSTLSFVLVSHQSEETPWARHGNQERFSSPMSSAMDGGPAPIRS